MSLSELLNGLIIDWTTVIKGLAALAAILIVVITAIVTKLAWGKMIVSAIVGGFLVWTVTMDGLGFFANSINQEVALPAPTSPVLVVTFDSSAGSWVLASEHDLVA